MSKVVCKVNDHIHRFYMPDVAGQHVPGGTLVELSPQEALTQEKAGIIEILNRDEVEFFQLETAMSDVTLAKKNQEIRYLKAKLAKQEAANTAEAENALLKQELAEIKKQLKNSAKKEEKPAADSVEVKAEIKSEPAKKKVVRKSKSITKKDK